jgi:hypothetical protein
MLDNIHNTKRLIKVMHCARKQLNAMMRFVHISLLRQHILSYFITNLNYSALRQLPHVQNHVQPHQYIISIHTHCLTIRFPTRLTAVQPPHFDAC